VKLKALLKNLKPTELRAAEDIEISGICYDSRRVVAGSLFVAIRGLQSDGHDHISSAVEKGAVCVICEKAPQDSTIPYVLVEDSRAALALVSSAFYGDAHKKLKIIGVTGTNGKTTTACLIKQMLESLTDKPIGLIGTLGDFIGDNEVSHSRATSTTPDPDELHELFAQMVRAGCEYAVMEVSSHALVLEKLTGVEFEVGIFTNLTQDHLDFHGSLEEYAKAKARLGGQSRTMAINIDDSYALTMIENATAQVMTFSTKNNSADLVAREIRMQPSKVEFCALMTGELVRAEIAIPGNFSVYNALAAMLALRILGFSLDECAAALQKCSGVPGRAESVPTGRDFTVLIDYAHTPDALENIISAVRAGTTGRVVTLFGCGGDRDRTKRPIMGETAAKLSDFLIVTSDNPRTEEPEAIIADILEGVQDSKTPYEVIPDRRAAIAYAINNAKPNDTIILAGKGHETYQEINGVKQDLDERVVVAEVLA